MLRTYANPGNTIHAEITRFRDYDGNLWNGIRGFRSFDSDTRGATGRSLVHFGEPTREDIKSQSSRGSSVSSHRLARPSSPPLAFHAVF